MGFADSIVNSSYQFDEYIKELVAEDRKIRILNLIVNIKETDILEDYNEFKEKIHYEIFSLEDSQLKKVLNILDENETSDLMSFLNESQTNRIIRLSDIDKLVRYPVKNKISNIMEDKPASNDEKYIEQYNMKGKLFDESIKTTQGVVDYVGKSISRLVA